MTPTECKVCRRANCHPLRWALGRIAALEKGIPLFRMGRRESPRDCENNAFYAVHDPAQLAAIVAELLRKRGLDVAYMASESHFNTDRQGHKWRVRGDRTFAIGAPNEPERELTMPQAHALTRCLLSIPDDATVDDVAKAIGAP